MTLRQLVLELQAIAAQHPHLLDRDVSILSEGEFTKVTRVFADIDESNSHLDSVVVVDDR